MERLGKGESFFDWAYRHGLHPWVAWNSRELADLKDKRKHPCYVQPGDEFPMPAHRPEKLPPPGRWKKITAYLRPKPKVIDVYLGFMDEEVNARLKEVIDAEMKLKDASKRRPVILIERGKVGPGDFILEWPIDNYPKASQQLTITQVSSKGEQVRFSHASSEPDPQGPDAILARVLAVFMEQDVPQDVVLAAKGVAVKRYVDFLSLLQQRMGPTSKVRLPAESGDDAAWLTVVRFSVGDDRQAPIVVIRTPEMGLQPSLMTPYVGFLFKAIAALADALVTQQRDRWRRLANPVGESEQETGKYMLPWPIRVCQFGAQGSTSDRPELGPGKRFRVIASLFVGQEIHAKVVVKEQDKEVIYDNGEAARKQDVANPKRSNVSEDQLRHWKAAQEDCHVSAVISLCTPAGIYEYYREDISGPDAAHRAEEKAKLKLKEFAGSPPHWTSRTPATGSPLLEDEKGLQSYDLRKMIEELVAKAKKAGNEGHVTLTTSFFAGQEEKEHAHALGIASVGMEDYHVLRVLQSALAKGADQDSDYPLLLSWRIDRINCDPRKIPAEVVRRFNDYIRCLTLTKQNYKDIIRWGFRGVLGLETPECAKWGFPGKVKDLKNASALFYSFAPHGKPFLPDPLCVEIATDFVKDVAHDSKKALGLGAPNESLQQKAKAVIDAVRNSRPDVEQSLDQFLDELIKGAEFFRQPGMKERSPYPPGTQLKTWLRPNKWNKDVASSSVQDLLRDRTFDGAMVDRAFYKSCNIVALQALAGKQLLPSSAEERSLDERSRGG